MDSSFLLIAVGVLLVFMIFNGSRQKKRLQAAQAERDAMGPGTRVLTHSGFIGTIVSRDGEELVLESDSGAQSTWLSRAISGERPVGAVTEDAGVQDANHDANQHADEIDAANQESDAPVNEAVNVSKPVQGASGA